MFQVVQELVLPILGFIAGKMSNAIGSEMERSREQRRTLERLTYTVEAIGGTVKEIRDEFREEVHDLRKDMHEQVDGLRRELRSHTEDQEQRFSYLTSRIDGVVRGHGFMVNHPPSDEESDDRGWIDTDQWRRWAWSRESPAPSDPDGHDTHSR